MLGIYFGNHQRYVLVHAKGARVRDDSAAGRRKCWLQFPSYIGVKCRENHLRRVIRRGRRHRHRRDPIREGRVQLPLHNIAVSLSARLIACREPRHFKPRVMLEELNEALKSAQPIHNPDNVELVKRYYDKIDAVLQ